MAKILITMKYRWWKPPEERKDFSEGAYIYRGVPYAYADRFQMPEETSWEGVKDATSYGGLCAR